MENKKLLLIILPFLVLSSCGTSSESLIDSSTSSSESTLVSEETTISSNDIDTSSTSSSDINQKVFTTSFESTLDKGYQYQNDTQKEEFKKQYFNTELVSSISLDKAQVYYNKDKDLYHTIQLGSKSSSGTLSLEFSSLVNKIELQVANYYNYYKDYSTNEYISTTEEANLSFINKDNSYNESYNLKSIDDLDKLVPTTITLNNTTSLNNLTIESSRVLLVSMSLYY